MPARGLVQDSAHGVERADGYATLLGALDRGQTRGSSSRRGAAARCVSGALRGEVRAACQELDTARLKRGSTSTGIQAQKRAYSGVSDRFLVKS